MNPHNIAWQPWFALVVFCLACCPFHLVAAIKKDVRDRAKYPNFYEPNLTLGCIIGWLVVCVMPIVNVYVAFYYLVKIAIGIYRKFSRFLNIPLVPRRKINHLESRGGHPG